MYSTLLPFESLQEIILQQNLSKSPGPQSYAWSQNQPAPAIVPFTAEEAKQHQEEWAKHLGVPVEMENSIGMKFRVIPPGEFLMGSSEEEIEKLIVEAKQERLLDWYVKRVPSEGPQHKVTLTKPIGLSFCEVTRGQFRQFVEATGYKTDAENDGKGGYGYIDGKWTRSPEFFWNSNLGFEKDQNDNHPVVNVSWNDAVAFCAWLSHKEGMTYRLPTEAEWEFACRAGNPGRYCFGDDESTLADYAWFSSQGGRNTRPVGGKRENAFGLFDLHGNVWEWCGYGFGPYNSQDEIDPVGTNEASLRGGCYLNPASIIRSANRNSFRPDYGSDCFTGFRTFEKYEPKNQNPPPTTGPKPPVP